MERRKQAEESRMRRDICVVRKSRDSFIEGALEQHHGTYERPLKSIKSPIRFNCKRLPQLNSRQVIPDQL